MQPRCVFRQTFLPSLSGECFALRRRRQKNPLAITQKFRPQPTATKMHFFFFFSRLQLHFRPFPSNRQKLRENSYSNTIAKFNIPKPGKRNKTEVSLLCDKAPVCYFSACVTSLVKLYKIQLPPPTPKCISDCRSSPPPHAPPPESNVVQQCMSSVGIFVVFLRGGKGGNRRP